ncbi:MAG: Unknown protein [uncultured Sulfurovum sp.]|uniref:RND efflux pump membrane fusion protein barrel-sandwich domain-containing protein n=1 Tax=uncultured Sulfurovum sp. TaxID=269237 RepID=A0A6S6SRV1_9BACT|nr:MAG: Unknown protein [uncultured Sulfurovum sp.]
MKKLLVIILVASIELVAVEFIGIIKPIHNVKISVPLDGVVQKLYVKEGSFVKKNTKILKLDDRLQRLELERRRVIWKDKAQLQAAIKNKKIQKSLLDSTEALYQQSRAVSEQELQLLKSKYHILNGEIKMREENEKKEKIEYSIANSLLSKYTITSPITGIVTEVNLEEGEWAKVGEASVRVVNVNTCFIDINIEEKYSSTLKVGNKINFNVQTNNVSAKKRGKITFISPVADMASGLVRIKIEFSNIKNRITPGLSARINIDSFSDNK